MISVKSREQEIWLTKSISRGFQTRKSVRFLALRAMFKISAEPRAPFTRGVFCGGGGVFGFAGGLGIPELLN